MCVEARHRDTAVLGLQNKSLACRLAVKGGVASYKGLELPWLWSEERGGEPRKLRYLAGAAACGAIKGESHLPCTRATFL